MVPFSYIRTLILALLLALLGRQPLPAADTVPAAWRGLCGKELKAAVAATSRPTALYNVASGEGSLWKIIFEIEGDGDCHFPDFFSATPFEWRGTRPSDDATLVGLVPQQWWSYRHTYGDTVAVDLYNRVPGRVRALALKGQFPPGEVTDPKEGGELEDLLLWLGYGFADGEKAIYWMPAPERKGQVARAVMYMLTVYAENIQYEGPASHFFDMVSWRIMAEGAARQMLAWNAAWPVSAVERERNSRFEALQGNRNPFVDFPELGEHIWGSRASEPFGETSEPAELVEPLRSQYHLTDAAIWLSSPYIPADASWRIDGKAIEGRKLNPSDLGVGRHRLDYRAGSSRGVLTIEIVP